MRDVADAASSTAAERLLAAEADDAIRFVEAMRQRYNVVLMNPPFGLAVESAEPYLRKAYPNSWTDLYAAFIERGRARIRREVMLSLRPLDERVPIQQQLGAEASPAILINVFFSMAYWRPGNTTPIG